MIFSPQFSYFDHLTFVHIAYFKPKTTLKKKTHKIKSIKIISRAGNRTRASRVRAAYPSH